MQASTEAIAGGFSTKEAAQAHADLLAPESILAAQQAQRVSDAAI